MSNVKETSKCLLDLRNIKVNKADREGDSPLHMTAHKQNTEIIKLLLEHEDIDVNALNKDVVTPLFYAANQTVKNMEVIKLLVASRADIGKVNN